MKSQIVLAVISFLFLMANGFAANILKAKGNSAIVELSESELATLNPSPGQSILITIENKASEASITKVAKNKILISTTEPLSAQNDVKITSGKIVSTENTQPRSTGKHVKNKSQRPSKNWVLGANLKYVLSGASKITINGVPINVKYSGIDLSGIGFYYWGHWGAGFEAEYAMLKGDDTTTPYSITQIQVSLLAEYKYNSVSGGVLFTPASNYKSSDSAGNENSLNGMGYGVFATYNLNPNIRFIFDYRISDYKLDPATIKGTDMRLGAGYYF